MVARLVLISISLALVSLSSSFAEAAKSVYGDKSTYDENEKGVTHTELFQKFKSFAQPCIVVLCMEEVYWGMHPNLMKQMKENAQAFLPQDKFRLFLITTKRATCDRVNKEVGIDCEVVTFSAKFTRDPRTERLWIDRVWTLRIALEAGKCVPLGTNVTW